MVRARAVTARKPRTEVSEPRQATGTTGTHRPALSTPLIETTFVVLDLETTGLSPAHDRIIEIGAVKVRGGDLLGELRTFVRPGRPIPAPISALTGITGPMVRDAPPIHTILPDVLRFLDRAAVVAHHARFDLGFLDAAATAIGLVRPEPVIIDTVRLARRLLPDELRSFDLATLAAHLHATVRPDHRALADAHATVDVLHGLIERAGSYDAVTLGGLCDLADAGPRRSSVRYDPAHEPPRHAAWRGPRRV